MAAQDAFNPGQEAASVTAAPNIQAVQARYDPNGSANALATALGSKSTQASLENFQQVYDQRKLQEQSLKIDGYTQQFMDDGVGGAVSQAQLKQRFPEMVPVIAARVAESIGRKQGALDIASTIEHINGNDSLRLDTNARAAYVAKTRSELFAKIQPGNDFYAAGVVSAMDRAFGQEEQKWQSQTATYHQEVQKVALSDEIVTALNSNDPKSMFSFIDGNYGASSSLSNIERNKVYVETTIKTAGASDDPAMLDKIPQQYLNADSKGQIAQAKLAIQSQQWAKYSRAKEFEADQRADKERMGMQDILNAHGSGQGIDPAKYLGSPALHAYAVKMLETPKVPDAASKSVVQLFEQNILAMGSSANLGSQANIIKAIYSLEGINPGDRAALVAKADKLMQGSILMDSPIVKDAYENHIKGPLNDLANSKNAGLQLLLTGTNLRGRAVKMFESGVRESFQEEYKLTGVYPDGRQARLLVDEVVEKVSKYMQDATSIEAISRMTEVSNGLEGTPTKSTPKATPSASSKPTPSASKAPTKSPAQLELERRANAK